MIPVAIDLETRPRDMTPAEMRANALTSSLNKCRKPDTRAEWADDPDNQIAAWARCSLSLTSARIVAWAVIVDGGPVQSWADWDDEAAGLRRLCGVLDSAPSGQLQWVGHNASAFDLPILRIAAMRHGLRYLRDAVPTYRYDKCIHDNMIEAVKPAGRITACRLTRWRSRWGCRARGRSGISTFQTCTRWRSSPTTTPRQPRSPPRSSSARGLTWASSGPHTSG